MELVTFEHIIGNIKKADEAIDKAYKGGVDLINLVDNHNAAIFNLLAAYYGKSGREWIDWFLYEKFESKNEPLQAFDKEGKEICKDLKELWEIIEDDRKSDDFVEFVPKKPMTKKEKIKFLNSIFGIKPSNNKKHQSTKNND